MLGHATTVVVVAGGPDDAEHRRQVAAALADEPGAAVVAADSGVASVLGAGRVPDLVVGDLDSADPADVAAVRAGGGVVERHPVAKDHTDLELALDVAVAAGASRLVVVGGLGGRVDHALAGALLLASPRFASVGSIEARLGAARVVVLHGPARVVVDAAPGAVVTLIPVHGDALGVSTTGLRYPLAGERLAAGSTRGVSNVVEGRPAAVELASGVLVVVEPRHDRGGASQQ